jgi:hypothetical protein
MVVIGSPAQQFEGDGVEYRRCIENVRCGFELVGGNGRLLGETHHDADQLPAAEGHPHPDPRLQRLAGEVAGRQIIENPPQRRVERHLQDRRVFFPQILWISLLRSRDHLP